MYGCAALSPLVSSGILLNFQHSAQGTGSLLVCGCVADSTAFTLRQQQNLLKLQHLA